MKRKTIAVMVTTTITSAQITSKEGIKERDQEIIKGMSKGKEDKSKKIAHSLIINLLLGLSM